MSNLAFSEFRMLIISFVKLPLLENAIFAILDQILYCLVKGFNAPGFNRK